MTIFKMLKNAFFVENGKVNELIQASDSTNKILNSVLGERNHQLQTCRINTTIIMRDFERSYCLWRSNNHRSMLQDTTEKGLIQEVNVSPGNITFKRGVN